MRASDALELLRRLEQRGIEVVACETTVRYRPRSAMSPDLAAEVVRLKPQLLDLLRRRADDALKVLGLFAGREVEPAEAILVWSPAAAPGTCRCCGGERWWRRIA